ncbi:MAG: hypothetical protein AAF721_30440, partial [Myxococcota bacterium]
MPIPSGHCRRSGLRAPHWARHGVALMLLQAACMEPTAPGVELAAVGGKADDTEARCEGLCGERNPVARCSCRSDCSALQDCCPDVAQTCEAPELVDRAHDGPGPLRCPGTRLDQTFYLSCHDDDWLIPRWVHYY